MSMCHCIEDDASLKPVTIYARNTFPEPSIHMYLQRVRHENKEEYIAFFNKGPCGLKDEGRFCGWDTTEIGKFVGAKRRRKDINNVPHAELTTEMMLSMALAKSRPFTSCGAGLPASYLVLKSNGRHEIICNLEHGDSVHCLCEFDDNGLQTTSRAHASVGVYNDDRDIYIRCFRDGCSLVQYHSSRFTFEPMPVTAEVVLDYEQHCFLNQAVDPQQEYLENDPPRKTAKVNGVEYFDDINLDTMPMLVGISGPMGIGKTQMLQKWCREHTHSRVLYVTNRRLLTRSAAKDMGLTYYEDNLTIFQHSSNVVENMHRLLKRSRLAMCINSIAKIPDTEVYDMIFFDEADFTREDLVSQTMQNVLPKVMSTLTRLLSVNMDSENQKVRLVLLQHELRATTCDFFGDLMGGVDYENPGQYCGVSVTKPPMHCKTRYTRDHSTLIADIVEALNHKDLKLNPDKLRML